MAIKTPNFVKNILKTIKDIHSDNSQNLSHMRVIISAYAFCILSVFLYKNFKNHDIFVDFPTNAVYISAILVGGKVAQKKFENDSQEKDDAPDEAAGK